MATIRCPCGAGVQTGDDARVILLQSAALAGQGDLTLSAVYVACRPSGMRIHHGVPPLPRAAHKNREPELADTRIP